MRCSVVEGPRNLEEVDARLERMMKRTYQRVFSMARDRGISMRIAAYALALESLMTAYDQRGIFP